MLSGFLVFVGIGVSGLNWCFGLLWGRILVERAALVLVRWVFWNLVFGVLCEVFWLLG